MKSCKSIGLASNWMDMRANDALVHGSSVCVYIYFYLYFESNTQKTFMVQRLSVKVFYPPTPYKLYAKRVGVRYKMNGPKKRSCFSFCSFAKRKILPHDRLLFHL